MCSFIALFVAVVVFVFSFGSFSTSHAQTTIRRFDIPVATYFYMPVGDRDADVQRDLRWGLRPVSWEETHETQLFPGGYTGTDGRVYQGWYVYTDFNTSRTYDGLCYSETCQIYHPGEDWNGNGGGNTDEGQPVYSIGVGRVLSSGWTKDFGNTVIIVHRLPSNELVASVYVHLQNSSPLTVNQPVTHETQVGAVGHSGSGAGPNAHLHWEIRKRSMLHEDTNGNISLDEPANHWPGSNTTFITNNYYDPSDFIRANSLVGVFADGWHTDGVSQAFLNTYNSHRLYDGHNKLGFPHPQNPYVFKWGEVHSLVQIFDQPDVSKSRFQDGFTWMMYNPDHRRCYVITMTFYRTYVGVTGDTLYGLPLNNEYIDIGVGSLIGQPEQPFIRQDFSLNKTMLWGGNPAVVSIIDTPLGTVRIAGGSNPLTLSGWPLSKTQVYVNWSGGLGIDSSSYYSVLQNGGEVLQTTLQEATLSNLTAGSIYTYQVHVYDRVYGILEQSNEITIQLPEDNRFELLPEVRDYNYVYLTIINERFPHAYAIAIYRDGQEIGRTQNLTFTEFSDPILAYNTTYIYRAAAITASGLILGWTQEVNVITQSPQTPLPPPPLPPAPQNQAAPFAVLRFNFLEPPPYVVNGLATADLVAKNIGTQPVIVGRFYVEGFFTYLPTSEVYSRNWKAIEFPDGFAMNPGDTYHYQMRNDGWAFPGIPTQGLLKAYVKVLGIVGEWEITQGIGDQSPYFAFEVENLPPPPTIPNLVPSIESVTQSPTTDDSISVNVVVDNNALVGSFPYRLDVVVDGIVERSYLMPEHIAGTHQRISANLGRLISGIHTIQVIADSKNEIQEIKEDDNNAQTHIIVAQVLRANLILSLGVEDKPHFIDENIPITITVANIGEAKSPPCQIGLGNSPFNKEKPGYGYFIPERLVVPEILPGKTSVLQVNFISKVADNFTLWAEIDSGREIVESDESDNFASLDIAVLSPPIVKTLALSPVEDITITRDWNNAAGIHEDPLAQTLDVYTRQGISRYGRALLRFDFSELPDFSFIESAELKLFQLNQGEYKDNQFYLNMLTQSFNSSYVTWVKRTSQYNWTSAGGKYSASYQTGLLIPSAYASTWHTQTGAVNIWRTWDATAFVQAVANGAITYRGCIVRQDNIANSRENQAVTFASQDYPDMSLRPKLIIKYQLGPKVVFKDNFELGIDARWYVNRTATGSVPVARLDATPVSVGVPVNSGDQILYLGDSTSGAYAQATMELDLDLSKYSEATLDFDWATYSLYGYECIRLDIFDGSWHYDVALYNTQAWQHKSIDLAPYNRAQFLTIRFRSWMDYPESSDAAYLDNVVVKGR